VRLGDAIEIDAIGFRSRLAGGLTLIQRPGRSDPLPSARGLLRILEGQFRSFGQDLDIEWGRIVYRPELDEATAQSYLLTGRGPDSKERLLSVGTRLRDDLYVGYGVNLLQGTHQFNLRYDILRGLGLEAEVGEADKSVTFSYTLER